MSSDGHDEFDDEAAAPDEWEEFRDSDGELLLTAPERNCQNRQAGLVPNPG